MTHDQYERQLYNAINALLEMPLSDEAAWQILNFLQVMTKLFDERFYPQAVRHANPKLQQGKQKTAGDNNDDTEIPWDDDIPF